MTALPIVRRITALKGLGVFGNATAASSPEFRRLNLVYGFNGCGKTTLSRIFASLEEGAIRPELPVGGSFEVELTDGTRVSSKGSLGSLIGRILVFNEDFVATNLRWKEGASNPIFFLGSQQIADANLLESKERTLDEATLQLQDARDSLASANALLAAHKRGTARVISEQLGLGRRYEAPHLTADYAAGAFEKAQPLSDSKIGELRQTIAETQPLPRVAPVSVPAFDLALLIKEAQRVLQTKLGALAIAELHAHAEMIEWAKTGRDYHLAHNLTSCLFCGSPLTEDRIELLEIAVGERVEKQLREARDTFEKIQNAQRECIRLSDSFPSQNDFYAAVREPYISGVEVLRRALKDGVRYYGAAIAALTTKVSNPNADLGAVLLIGEDSARQWTERVSLAVQKLNEVIVQHNNRSDDFATVQQQARDDLKGHYLSVDRSKYDELSRSSESSEELVATLRGRVDELVTEIDQLKKLVRRHGPAAAVLNRLLKSYLGRDEIELVPTQEAYQIYRSGQPLTGKLSEGEKTAIALCYFMTLLEAEGRQTRDLIVVIDDPISSLDTRALHYAFNIIKGRLESAGQLIIATHNLHFLNEVKKWFKGLLRSFEAKNNGGMPPVALMFVDTTQDVNGARRSTLIELPKLIRDYESEYHYLFYLALNFGTSFATFSDYFYLMPNALRKVMDIFFAFKVPGPHGLASKIDTIAKGRSLDANVLRAIDRLVQLESHADSLDDLVSLSSLTMEETREAAAALLSFIQAVEPEHFEQMRRLCKA